MAERIRLGLNCNGSFTTGVDHIDDTSKANTAGPVGSDQSPVGAGQKGAVPELAGFAVIALAAMGLLPTGYHWGESKVEMAASTTPATQTTGMSPSMAQPTDSSNQPKVYQPANPTPDTRSAPTSSDSGVGDQNGSTGQSK